MLLKAKKCELFQQSIEYLGHNLSQNGISMCTNKVDKIKHWPPCQNLEELRSFIVTYHSPFIQNFAKLCNPFYQLMRKNPPFIWSSKCQNSFDKLKELVTTAPILGVPKLDKGKFTITTDGSLQAILTRSNINSRTRWARGHNFFLVKDIKRRSTKLLYYTY